MQPQPFEYCLTTIFISAIYQNVITLTIIPNLLNQYLLLKVVEETLDIFGHFDIEAEPVDRDKPFINSDAEDVTILSV